MLSRHARCVLSRLRCIAHSLLLSSYLFRIGKIENPSCSACGHSSQNTSHLITVQLRPICAARSLATLCLFTTFGPGSGELSCFWGSMVFHHVPISRKGSGNNNSISKILHYTISVHTKPQFSICFFIAIALSLSFGFVLVSIMKIKHFITSQNLSFKA